MINPHRVGFVGLGVMGQSMAAHLLTAGYELHVFNRTKSKADALLAKGAIWEDSLQSLAEKCEAVITILGYPHDVEQVYLGPGGLVETSRPGTLLVDMTTSSPELAKRIYEDGAVQRLKVLDAPVSGGDVGAKAGTLSIMVGGERDTYETGLSILACMGKNIVYQGAAGSGQHCKMCNQITIASTMVGVCEALAYAQTSGLNPETVLKSISKGAAASWALENLAPRMLKGDFDPGFFVKHFIKDMGVAAKSAEQMTLGLPGLDLALARYRELNANGLGDAGTQALFDLYQGGNA